MEPDSTLGAGKVGSRLGSHDDHRDVSTSARALLASSEQESVTRERLLQQGLRLLLARGYTAASTRQICAAAGVTQPSLYHHFGSKDGLYVAALERWFQIVFAAITREIARDTSFPGRLHRVAVIFWSGEVGDYQAMQRDALRHLPPARALGLTATIFQAVVAPMLSVMRDAMASGELPPSAHPGALTQLYWALVDGLAGAYHRGDPLPPPEANSAPIALWVAGARALDPALLASWPTIPTTWPDRKAQEEQMADSAS